LILPPVVLALPFLVLYKALGLLDTRIGLILLYTLTVLPIVIWIMRDQFAGIPKELEEAAMVAANKRHELGFFESTERGQT
jgi:multiple sugar transport system permease protein